MEKQGPEKVRLKEVFIGVLSRYMEGQLARSSMGEIPGRVWIMKRNPAAPFSLSCRGSVVRSAVRFTHTPNRVHFAC